MNDFEAQLDLIDDQLQGYSPLQRKLIIFGSALGIVFMGWMFYISDALEQLQTLTDENSALAQQVADNSPDAYRAKITQTKALIAKEQLRSVSLENEKNVMLDQMSSSRGLIFDNRIYASMLDLLLERSVRMGIKIERMDSVDSDKLFFGKVREQKVLTVTGQGSFPAIAEFVRFAESQNALVQLQTLNVRSNGEKPSFKAQIVYMGVDL